MIRVSGIYTTFLVRTGRPGVIWTFVHLVENRLKQKEKAWKTPIYGLSLLDLVCRECLLVIQNSEKSVRQGASTLGLEKRAPQALRDEIAPLVEVTIAKNAV